VSEEKLAGKLEEIRLRLAMGAANATKPGLAVPGLVRTSWFRERPRFRHGRVAAD
jgi:hypothetical protein